MGCNVSDHALEYVMYQPASDEEIEAIFAKRKSGAAVTRQEELQYKTAFMLFCRKTVSSLKLGNAAPLWLQARQQHTAL